MADLRILILSDGRPGHTNLSEGIAAALGRHRAVEITRLGVDRGKWPGPVAALLTRSTFTPQGILKIVYGLEPSDLPPADIIISAGGETLAANICAARILDAQNIFYGSLRQYRAADFTLVLTSFARQAKRAPNIVQALKPSALDPDTLPTGPADAPAGMLGLLVGGPTSGVVYRAADWQALTRLVRETTAAFGIRWIASNSRRTPPEMSAALRELVTAEDTPIAELLDVDGPAAQSLPELLAKVSGIVCTADSSSMISEAIWARKPVVAVEPAKFALTHNEQDYRNWLTHNGWATSKPIAGLTPQKLAAAIAELQPNQRNPLDDLADLLQANLPSLRA
jgi:mitochondrial fission protein ELM1